MTEKIFEFKRGWRSLLAAAIGTGAGVTGLAFYSFGVFIIPLVDAFGWSRGEISSAASFLILGTALTAPVVGGLVDRFGARRVGLLSMLAGGIGFAAMTTINDSLALFYAAWFVLAVVGGGTTPVVWTRTVNLWFDKSRGLALGVALAGSGLASFFAPPTLTWVISRYGWQGGYLAMGGFLLLVAMPLIALLLKEHPPVIDPTASAATTTTQSPVVIADKPIPGVDFAEALRHPVFWKIASCFFLVSGVISALIINLIPLLVDRGLDRMRAASIAGLMGISVLTGRILIGFLLDRCSAALVATVVLAVCALGCFVLYLPEIPTWLIILSVLAIGLAAAAEVDLVAYLSSRYFGLRAYGRIYGWQLTSFYLGAALSPVLTGMAYDRLQSYGPILFSSAAGLILGALILLTLGTPLFREAN